MTEMKSPNVHAKKNRNDTPRKRKTHIIKVRVTAEEKLRIAYACKELHLTQSELVRRVLYGVNVKHTVVVAQGGEDALAALATLSAQCSKVGSNLNQLAACTALQLRRQRHRAAPGANSGGTVRTHELSKRLVNCMATIKHLSSKNSNYAAAESYLTFQHNEYTGLPILDEKGRPKLRDSYLLDTLECGESSFAMACLIANRKYGKNGRREDVKTHHYIVSFDPKDAVENGLTMERAQALGLQFCRDNFPGHPAIVCTHPDGHNSAGNIHVHIVIGSLRVRTVERQPFMDKPCDWEAGKKHRCTSAMLRHLRVAVMEMCEQADLNQINLLEAQGDHVSEREYWAQRRGQRRLDHANAKLTAEGQQPTQTVYQTELDKLRQIYAVLNKTTTFEEFSALLIMQEHGIAVKESRGRLSYCPPGRTKFITAKKLSKKLEKEQVLTALSQNIQLATAIQPACEQKPDKIRKLVDIQANVAAGKGIGYERWAKKFNLKRWSQTLCLLQEKKLLSEDALHQRIAELQTQHDDALAVVKDMDARMVSLKELRGHLVVYRQYKPLAQKLQTVRNPAKFKEQHRAEFAVYEAACAYFKANGLRTLPDLKKLDAEYQTLSSEKNGFYTRYKKAQIELRELRTAQQNVEAFFRKEERNHAVPQQEVK